MRKIICTLVIFTAMCVPAFPEDFSSSIMNFNDFVTRDESGVEWTPSGDPGCH